MPTNLKARARHLASIDRRKAERELRRKKKGPGHRWRRAGKLVPTRRPEKPERLKDNCGSSTDPRPRAKRRGIRN